MQFIRMIKRRSTRSNQCLLIVTFGMVTLTLWTNGNLKRNVIHGIFCYSPLRFVMSRGICSYKTETLSGVALDDILSMTPPEFLTNYKNPCWKDGGKLKCLPYFMFIGLDKCATTDLFMRIIQHPELLNNTGDLGKEPLWWAWRRYGYGYYWFKDKPMQDFEKYLTYFDKAAQTIEAKATSNGYHPLITVDGSVVDMWDFSGWPQIHQNHGLKEPKVLTPHLIKHINPNTKFMVMLREPVERLYSDYLYWGLSNRTKEGFHRQLLKSIKVLENCLSENTLKSCAYNRTFHLASVVRIHVGFYHLYLQEWFKVFPREQFLILRMEDYARNRSDTIRKIFKFLNFGPVSRPFIDKISGGKPHYVTESKLKAGPMMNFSRELLRELYTPHNKKLSELLKDPSFTWIY